MACVIVFSVCCLAIGNGAAGWTAQSRSDLKFGTGWLSYTLNSAPAQSLRSLGAGASVSCIVAAAIVAGSAALAAAALGVVCCGGAGGALAALAAPAGVLVAAGLCVAYAVSAAVGARKINETVGRTFVPYPSTGWALGMGSALAWEFAACIACGLPPKRRGGGAGAPAGAGLGSKRSTEPPPAVAAPFTADLDPEVATALVDPKTPTFYGTGGGKSKKNGNRGGKEGAAPAAATADGPAAPASAFSGSLASGAGSGSVHAAPPAVSPPPPEALPPPTSLGFFAAARDSIKRVTSSTKE